MKSGTFHIWLINVWFVTLRKQLKYTYEFIISLIGVWQCYFYFSIGMISKIKTYVEQLKDNNVQLFTATCKINLLYWLDNFAILKNERTIDSTKVNWNKDWDVHKAMNVMGFKTWRLFEPGKILSYPHVHGYMDEVHHW